MHTVAAAMTRAPERSEILADPALRRGLARFAASRVPQSDVEDIVQSALTDALAAPNAPDDEEQLRRWVFGVVRHKVADYYRRAGREGPVSSPLEETVPAESAPLSARELVRWAERELPEGEHAEDTLEWMMREAGGDKLENIAQEERIPAPRVRQRVARMRRHFRERWALQAAVLAILAVVVVSLAVYKLRPQPVDIAREEPSAPPGPEQRAAELRRLALEDCDASLWQSCLERLDQARALDPAGDEAPVVREARDRAAAGLAPAPSPDAQPSAAPSALAPPRPAPTELEPPKERPRPIQQKRKAPIKAKPAPKWDSELPWGNQEGK